MTEFTHISRQGHAKVVDVSDKRVTEGTTIVHPSIIVSKTIYKQISNSINTKDNILSTTQIVGTITAKNTSTIIPMCHPLPLTGIDVHFNWDEANAPLYTLSIQTTVSTTGKTGVEVEVLTAASATALTIYGMTRAAGKSMIIGEAYLESKSDGKSGDLQRQLDQ